MKIIYISHFFVSRLYQKKVVSIAKCGVEVIGIAPPYWVDEGRKQAFEPGNGGTVALVPAHFIGSGSLYWFSPIALARLFRRFDPDVIHVDEEPWSLACLEAVMLKWLFCPRATFVFDSSENLDKRIPFPFGLVETLIFRCAAAATAISDEVKARLIRRKFHGPVSVIGHGVDLQDYTHPAGLQRHAHHREGEFRVGYIGIIARRKGVLVLLDAFRQAAPAAGTLLFVGAGEALEETKAQVARDSFLASRVRFHDPVSHSKVAELMASLDVLVLPSLTTPRWKEQFGRVLIEAMASRLAVIGSDSGGIPSVIADAGIVVPEGNAKALAAVLARLSTDRVEVHRLADLAFRRVEEKFTWGAVARQVTQVYESCVPRLPQ